jgi:hypothetical protein
MDGERMSMAYASTAAQAVKKSTSATTVHGRGDYAAQGMADVRFKNRKTARQRLDELKAKRADSRAKQR